MRAARSIALRVLLVAALSGLLGTASAYAVAWSVVRGTLKQHTMPLVTGRFRGTDAEMCAANPEAWSLPFPMLGVSAYAYDGERGMSRNPAAPPLDRGMLARLGPRAPLTELRGINNGGTILFRTGAPAPCDVVQLLWPRVEIQRHIGSTLLASGAASAFFASALGFCALVLPLARRIRALRAAATRVGDAGSYMRWDAQGGDELDAVGTLLDEAHARIQRDARLLAEQRDALERHLANIAHDLRTPLTSLQMALEYAADAEEPKAFRESITGALRDTVYITGLIANLRLASRLRTGWNPADDVGDVDLADVVARIAARGEKLARRRGITLEVALPDDPVVVRCNAVAAEQAIGNLVDNAVAHGDAHGHVAVVLGACENGRDLCVEVRDDGPGVPPKELPRLGERTFRSDEAGERDPRGSGLGLAITAEVCTRFGWTIQFSSLAPRGLLVTIRIPRPT